LFYKLMTEEVKFSLCSMTDLRGFSSHLETSDYDLRTQIGKEAIRRLELLQKALDQLQEEAKRLDRYYPNSFAVQRINDALFVAMDLDRALLPEVGSTRFAGLTPNRLNELISDENSETYEDWDQARTELIMDATRQVEHFVGMVSRLHLTVNKREAELHFPGAKTLVSTGFRRSVENDDTIESDMFSANFALSNVSIAEKHLHGTGMFIDDNVLQMLSYNGRAYNLVKFSMFLFEEEAFNPFNAQDNVFWQRRPATIRPPIEAVLFRKRYFFREVNPSPLSYLQQVAVLRPFWNGSEEANFENYYYKHIYHAIQYGPTDDEASNLSPRPSFIYNGTNDLDVDAGVFFEFLSTGESATQQARAEAKHRADRMDKLAEHGLEDVPDDHPIHAELDELEATEVTLDIKMVDIEDFGDTIYQVSEEVFSGSKFMIEGDWDTIDYDRP
jgi:hypothetical protein